MRTLCCNPYTHQGRSPDPFALDLFVGKVLYSLSLTHERFNSSRPSISSVSPISHSVKLILCICLGLFAEGVWKTSHILGSTVLCIKPARELKLTRVLSIADVISLATSTKIRTKPYHLGCLCSVVKCF